MRLVYSFILILIGYNKIIISGLPFLRHRLLLLQHSHNNTPRRPEARPVAPGVVTALARHRPHATQNPPPLCPAASRTPAHAGRGWPARAASPQCGIATRGSARTSRRWTTASGRPSPVAPCRPGPRTRGSQARTGTRASTRRRRGRSTRWTRPSAKPTT